MSNKITATFGADVSEAEAAMLKATRATKAYERAVREVDKAEATRSSGGIIGTINSGAPKALGHVKALSGAFGQAAAAAGLVPGLGMAAIGVAGVVAGVNMIRKHYEEAAESAKRIQEYMTRSGARREEQRVAGLNDEERLQDLTNRAEDLRNLWKSAITLNLGNEEILKRREAYELAEIDRKKQIKEVNKERAEAEKRAADEARSRNDKNFEQLQRNEQRRKDAAEKEKKLSEELAKLQEENARKSLDLDGQVSEAGIAMEKAVQRAKKTGATQDKIDAEKLTAIYRELFDKLYDQQQKQEQELDQLKYDAIWRYATLEQRAAQVRKEGREAQARAEKDASAENLIALEKTKNRYRDLVDEAKKLAAQTKDAVSGEIAKSGLTRGDDGKLRRGKVVVSEEDAARAIMTRRKAEQHTRESKRGEIETSSTREVKAGANALKKSEDLLASIDASLKPKKR